MTGIYKIITVPPTVQQGSETVPLVDMFDPMNGLTKTAAVDMSLTLANFLDSLTSKKGKIYLLANALSDGAYYGPNINSDYFTWEGLSYEPPGWNEVRFDPVKRIEFANRYAASKGYGYITFYAAHNFVHHVNFDPFASHNKHQFKPVGKIVYVEPNHKMHRIELVMEIDLALAEKNNGQGFVDRIYQGEYPYTSMGTKVPYDICSICGNKAVTRNDYCSHIRDYKGKILPDGKRVYMVNTRPRFFDQSLVEVPADPTAGVLGKVASVSVQVPVWIYNDKIGGFDPIYQQGLTKTASNELMKIGALPSPQQQLMMESGMKGMEMTESKTSLLLPKKKIDEAAKRIIATDPAEKKVVDYVKEVKKLEEDVKQGKLLPAAKDILVRNMEIDIRSQGVNLEAYKKRMETQLKTRLAEMGFTDRAKTSGALFNIYRLGVSQVDESKERQKLLKALKAKSPLRKNAAVSKFSMLNKKSIIEKPPVGSVDRPAQHISDLLEKVREKEERLPSSILDAIAKSPTEGLTTAGKLGIKLNPEEFKYMTLKHLGMPMFIKRLMGMPFPPFMGGPVDMSARVLPQIRPGRGLLSMLLPFLQNRSGLGPVITKRIIRISIIPASGLGKLGQSQYLANHNDLNLLQKIASAYEGYTKSLTDPLFLRSVDDFVNNNYELQSYINEDKYLDMLSGHEKTAESAVSALTEAYFKLY